MPELFSTGVYRCRKSSEIDEMLLHNLNTGYNLGVQTGFVFGVAFVSAVFVFATLGVKSQKN